ncbi:ABC transporter ATP-binding protein [Pandoraea terrae]|uniref:ABC transporter ATP-binding protein n=1 Tax=Pandoraea terrae TaxID=1537710 RepID=A0A5E4RIQ1_9BURK|nr:ABC transporter ATP-binding protein [Pandoraea terrae]VVD63166.1 ABC transporter ATP-binding protein [Pandoraea terrae]
MSEILIETAKLTLFAGTRKLLEGLNLRVAAGECWCLAGPNGAGKTTLLSTLAGLRPVGVAHGQGRILVQGRALAEWKLDRLSRVRALMPQQTHDAFGATALEIVLAGRHPYLAQGRWGAWESASDLAAAHAALDAVAMSAFAERDVTTLSGGERQRVALAAVFAQHTPLLLLDEPVSHLDLHHQIECLALLAARAAERTSAALFSCHDLNLARRFATHALLLDGRGGWRAGPAGEVLSAEYCSDAFGYPLRLIRDGEDEALVPVRRA